MAVGRVSVEAEWHRLESVAVVRPERFVLTEPINRTQRQFYGTREQPSTDLVLAQHDAVLDHLAAAGVQIVEIHPAPDLPYQFNVRDAGVVIGSRLVLGRMTFAVRAREPTLLATAFTADVQTSVTGSGHLEGGDVAVGEREIFVGLGERTNEAGYLNLRNLLAGTRTVTPIQLAPGVLHLDVAFNLLAPGLGLVHRPSIVADLPDSLRDVEWIEITDKEFVEQAANMLALDRQTVMLDARQERLQSALVARGIHCLPVELGEITKVGGGVRCMTLPLVREAPKSSIGPAMSLGVGHG